MGLKLPPFRSALDQDGPAYYEIGTGGPRGNIAWHYVGETVNEKNTNACACPSKGAAKQMQDNLLGRWVRLEPRGELTA